MPTVLMMAGWRLFFYANEGNEPIHIHCRKGERECKYWLDRERFDLEEVYAYNLSPRDRRDIKKIIFEHFEYIEQRWEEFQWSRQSWSNITTWQMYILRTIFCMSPLMGRPECSTSMRYLKSSSMPQRRTARHVRFPHRGMEFIGPYSMKMYR